MRYRLVVLYLFAIGFATGEGGCPQHRKCRRNNGICILKSESCNGATIVQPGYCKNTCKCCTADIQDHVSCSASNLSPCTQLGGSCIGKLESCSGSVVDDSKGLFCSNPNTCKCCYDICKDCSSSTLAPCSQLPNGRCIGLNEVCDGSVVPHGSVNFCTDPTNCRCCFTACSDTNDCSTNPCGSKAICQNTQSGYTCTCPAGFEPYPTPHVACKQVTVGISCSGTFFCVSNAACINGKCKCNSGYQEKGPMCLDIDECKFSPCGDNAICTNLPGKYHCMCKSGYTGNPPYKLCKATEVCKERSCRTFYDSQYYNGTCRSDGCLTTETEINKCRESECTCCIIVKKDISTASGHKCVFPFIFNGIDYNDCAPGTSQPHPWCATSTNADKTVKTWSVCVPLECRKGCFNVGSQCFWRAPTNTSKADVAAQICEKYGLQLAEPKDPQALAKHLDNTFTKDWTYWIGARGTGNGNNGNTKWSSGSVIGPDAPWFGNWYKTCKASHFCMYIVASSDCYDQHQCFGCWFCNLTLIKRTPLCNCK